MTNKMQRDNTRSVESFIDKNRDYLTEVYTNSYPEKYMGDDSFERAENDMMNSKRVYEIAQELMHEEYAKYINK